jgi:hypothetical protein
MWTIHAQREGHNKMTQQYNWLRTQPSGATPPGEHTGTSDSIEGG